MARREFGHVGLILGGRIGVVRLSATAVLQEGNAAQSGFVIRVLLAASFLAATLVATRAFARAAIAVAVGLGLLRLLALLLGIALLLAGGWLVFRRAAG